MGLDMYLTKKFYVGAEQEHRNVKGVIYITVGEKKLDINFQRVCEISERIGYWRKANQIHKWFVDNVQEGKDDCGKYYVSRAKLQELLDLVRTTLITKNTSLLPTQNGCFFGSTEYNDDYFKELEYTLSILEQAIKEGGEFYYSSSW